MELVSRVSAVGHHPSYGTIDALTREDFMLRITIPEVAVALALGVAACAPAAPSATVTTATTKNA